MSTRRKRSPHVRAQRLKGRARRRREAAEALAPAEARLIEELEAHVLRGLDDRFYDGDG
jgi:hypothetical protein